MRAKLQAEIDSKLGPIKDDFNGKFDLAYSEQFTYLRNCFYEALRIEAPVTTANNTCFD